MSIIKRLSSALDVGSTNMTLIGKPGERIVFGCSNRIRHTLAPDNSSLTFSTKNDLFNHWLCVVSLNINRDWSWDGLNSAGIEVRRTKDLRVKMILKLPKQSVTFSLKKQQAALLLIRLLM